MIRCANLVFNPIPWAHLFGRERRPARPRNALPTLQRVERLERIVRVVLLTQMFVQRGAPRIAQRGVVVPFVVIRDRRRVPVGFRLVVEGRLSDAQKVGEVCPVLIVVLRSEVEEGNRTAEDIGRLVMCPHRHLLPQNVE